MTVNSTKQVTRRFILKRSNSWLLLGAVPGFMASLKIANAQPPYRYNPEHRRPVEAAMRDLRMIASRNTYSGHERERYDNALRHLSEFGRRLHEGGYFDKGKLDQAIGDIQSVIDHNPMPERSRRMLERDDAELRRLREAYDRGYRYPR